MNRRKIRSAGATRLSANDLIALVASAMVAGAMLVRPLPPWTLDALIAVDAAAVLAILPISLFRRRPAELSLLVAASAILRTGANLAVARAHLFGGQAGFLVQAAGDLFVSAGHEVGLVLFTVVTAVQLIVIREGAVRSRLLRVVQLESMLALALTALVVVAGASLPEAIGAGLIAQFSAFFATVSAGVLTARSRREVERRKVWIASAATALFALIPSLPAFPFVLLSSILVMVDAAGFTTHAGADGVRTALRTLSRTL